MRADPPLCPQTRVEKWRLLTRARPGAQNARSLRVSLRADLRRPREHRTTAIFQRGHFKIVLDKIGRLHACVVETHTGL